MYKYNKYKNKYSKIKIINQYYTILPIIYYLIKSRLGNRIEKKFRFVLNNTIIDILNLLKKIIQYHHYIFWINELYMDLNASIKIALLFWLDELPNVIT